MKEVFNKEFNNFFINIHKYDNKKNGFAMYRNNKPDCCLIGISFFAYSAIFGYFNWKTVPKKNLIQENGNVIAIF